MFFGTTSLFFTGDGGETLGQYGKSVVVNKGCKRYLEAEKGAFAVDLDKARDEDRFDGGWVLRTNTELSAVEVALRYEQLWMVEQVFRTAKSLLDTRPIFHETDATICGHVYRRTMAERQYRTRTKRTVNRLSVNGKDAIPSSGTATFESALKRLSRDTPTSHAACDTLVRHNLLTHHYY